MTNLISGSITNADYLNINKVFVYRYPVYIKRILNFLGFIVTFLMAAIGWYFFGVHGAYMAVSIYFITVIIFTVSYKIALLSNEKHFIKHAKVHNLGHSTYEIVENNIIFNGTTFNCEMPISSITDIKSHNGTTCLMFGEQAGFIIPKIIENGDLPMFVEIIRSRLTSR